MRVVPNLGIGDLLILKMRAMTSNVDIDTIAIRHGIVRDYRVHQAEYTAFIRTFLSRLFPGVAIEDGEDDEPSVFLHSFPIHIYRLYNTYAFEVPRSLPIQDPYVVFHTRARFDRRNSPLPELKSLQSSYPIVLLGERVIETNEESISNPIYSLYPSLRQLPRVVDLTRDSTASDNTIEQFERDLHIINGARFNVVFGYGGPLSLSMAFGRHTFAYIGNICHSVVDAYSHLEFLHRDIGQFLRLLQIKLL